MGRTTGRQVELSKVVDEALQGVARLGLCRIRKLAFGARLDPGGAVVEQELEARPPGHGRSILVGVHACHVHSGFQSEKRADLVDDGLCVIHEALKENDFYLVFREKVKVAFRLSLVRATKEKGAGAVLKLVFEAVNGPARLHTVPVVRVRSVHRIS